MNNKIRFLAIVIITFLTRISLLYSDAVLDSNYYNIGRSGDDAKIKKTLNDFTNNTIRNRTDAQNYLSLLDGIESSSEQSQSMRDLFIHGVNNFYISDALPLHDSLEYQYMLDRIIEGSIPRQDWDSAGLLKISQILLERFAFLSAHKIKFHPKMSRGSIVDLSNTNTPTPLTKEESNKAHEEEKILTENFLNSRSYDSLIYKTQTVILEFAEKALKDNPSQISIYAKILSQAKIKQNLIDGLVKKYPPISS